MGKGGDDHKYDVLMGQLQPLIDVQKEIAGTAGKAGIANVDTAKGDLNYVGNFFKTIISGPDEDLLKFLDVAGATRNIDENEKIINELGVRGGKRAAALSQTTFNRDAALNNLLKQLKFMAPDKIASVAQVLGNLGLGELSASVGAGAQASNTYFGVEQLKQNDADRRSNLIGGIFETIGLTAGMIACVTLDTMVLTQDGYIPIKDINVGDYVSSLDDDNNIINRKVIRKRISEGVPIRTIIVFDRTIRTSPSHIFYDADRNRVICEELRSGSAIPTINLAVGVGGVPQGIISVAEVISTNIDIADVCIIKLEDETRCYPFITNDFLSEDDDPISE